jgi:hypothetical protein
MDESLAHPGSASDTTEDLDEDKKPRRSFLVPGLIAGAVLSFLLAVTFFALWLQSSDPSATEMERQVSETISTEQGRIEDVTQQVVNILTTYDETNADQLKERMSAVATGSFLANFEQLFGAGLDKAIENASVSSRGRILTGPTVGFKSGSEAFAVVTVTQTYQNINNPGGFTVQYVLEIDFVKTSTEGWRADRVDLLSITEG